MYCQIFEINFIVTIYSLTSRSFSYILEQDNVLFKQQFTSVGDIPPYLSILVFPNDTIRH